MAKSHRRLVVMAVLAAVPLLPPSLHAALIPTFTAGNGAGNAIQVSPGSLVSVPITVSDFSGVLGAQFTLSWSAGVLQYAGTANYNSQLGNLGAGNFGTDSTASGVLTFAWIDNSGDGKDLTAGATLFTVQFTAISAEGTSSPVNFGDGLVTLVDFSEETPFTINGGVSVVPEPTNWALGLFASVLIGAGTVRWLLTRRSHLPSR